MTLEFFQWIIFAYLQNFGFWQTLPWSTLIFIFHYHNPLFVSMFFLCAFFCLHSFEELAKSKEGCILPKNDHTMPIISNDQHLLSKIRGAVGKIEGLLVISIPAPILHVSLLLDCHCLGVVEYL